MTELLSKMDKTEVFSILLSSAVLLAGAFAGYFHEPMDFARSGSVLVVIAVFFTVFGAKPKLDNLLVTATVKHSTASLKYDFDMANKEDKELSEKLDNYIERIKNEVERRSFRALKVEAAILVVGTLIWGFGDLAYKII